MSSGKPGPFEEPSDQELMGLFYNASESAFDTLSDRWWRRLYGFFRRHGFTSEEAEDLAQETLVRLYLTREKRTYDLCQPLEPFLLTMARRMAINAWRRKQPAARLLPLDEACDVPCGERAGLTEAALEDLFRCIWALPEQLRTYVLLSERYGVGDLSHNEIAAVMGKWPAQITRISQRSLEMLRECLSRKGYR